MPDPDNAPEGTETESPRIVLAGRYQVLECIGEGGMGVVWRCHDLELDEVVAIKFLHEDLAGERQFQARFRDEVKLARRISHPNVARMFGFSNYDGLYFLTMEYIAGWTLQSVLEQQGCLPPVWVYALATDLCMGLASAHAAHVVHGDIKPGNIMLAPQRGAVLTDFGLARSISSDTGRNSFGTPVYMAPEQVLGGTLTGQSDIYALGVVMFQALTGKLPWSGIDTAGVLAAKRNGAEPNLREIAPDLPQGWLELLGECLRSDPARRPSGMIALLRRMSTLCGIGDGDERRYGPVTGDAVVDVLTQNMSRAGSGKQGG